MQSLPYPQLTAMQYYILALLCGFFLFSFPIYCVVVILLLLWYTCTLRVAYISLLLFSLCVGVLWEYSIYREKEEPSWYVPGATYTIRATVDSIRLSGNRKKHIIVRDIIPIQRVVIQKISKHKTCAVKQSGTLLYTKARSCAVGYALQENTALPYRAIYTVVDEKLPVSIGQTVKGIFTIDNIRTNENGSMSQYYRHQHIQYRMQIKDTTTQQYYGEPTCIGMLLTKIHTHFNSIIESLYGKERGTTLSKIDKDTIGIVYALLLGTRHYLSADVEDMLRSAGLLHSIVLSGLHVSSLLLFAFPCMLLCRRCMPHIVYYIPTRHITLFCLVIFSLIYAVLTSFPISYIRAVCMLCIVFLFAVSYRRYTLLDVLLYAILAVSIVYPESLNTISLTLSCGAVFAIYFSLPLTRAYIQRLHAYPMTKILRSCLECIGSVLITTASIHVVLLPLLLSSFGGIPHSIFLNFVWTPVLMFYTLPILLIAYLFSLCNLVIPILWYAGLAPIKVLLHVLYILHSQEWFAVVSQMRPHILTTISLYLALFSYMLVCNGRSGKRVIYTITSVSIVCMLIPIGIRVYKYVDNAIYVDIIDVGKGQAVLIEYKNNRMLVDAGGKTKYFDAGERILSPLLTYNNAPVLQGLLLTHQDNDHIGGAEFLMQHYDIHNMYYNGDRTKVTATTQAILTQRKTKDLTVVKEGDRISFSKDVYIDILLPRTNDIDGKTSNAKSIVAMLVYKGRNCMLLLGDIDRAGQKYIVERYGARLQCDAIVLPHHGSRYNFYRPLYEVTKAKYAIASTASVGGNFVSKRMQQILHEYGMALYTTYTHGRITYTYNNNAPSISYVKHPPRSM